MSDNILSVIIIAGNESDMIVDCLKSCNFADEIIVASNSTDNTLDLVEKTTPRVIIKKINLTPDNFNFSTARNMGFEQATGKWILYLDCDERITPKLQQEITKIITTNSNDFTNYDIPRANYYLNKRVRYGGSYPDYVKRLFLKDFFKGYQGIVHEQPIISGSGSVLKNDLIHLTHRDLKSMLEKSLKWTKIEAEMLFKSGHPPVVWWRFIRMMSTKLGERLLKQQMWRDGTVGFISVIFEMFNTFIIYARLWELQQTKTT